MKLAVVAAIATAVRLGFTDDFTPIENADESMKSENAKFM